GLVDLGAAAAAELAAAPATLDFGSAPRSGWLRRRSLLVRNVSTRPLAIAIRTTGRGGVELASGRPRLVPAPGRSARVLVTARLPHLPRAAAVAAGAITLAPLGGASVRVPWALRLESSPPRLLGPLRLSARRFRPSDTAPAVLAVEAGAVTRV